MPAIPLPSVKCTYCGRENAGEAAQCHECGTALPTDAAAKLQEAQREAEKPVPASAMKQMLRGGITCGVGIFVTVFTYSMASGPRGGTYIVAWGAIIFGGIRFFRGWSMREVPVTVEDAGYEDLNHATQLETRGRVHEALVIYEKVAKTYANTPAGDDARKSFESLRAKLG